MKPLALLLAVLLPITSFAQAADAPVNPHPEGRSMRLEAGEVLPFGPSLCLESTEAQRREWVAQRDLGELTKLKESRGAALVPVPVFVAIVAGALAMGVAVGVGATLAARR